MAKENSFIHKLKERWGITSALQVIIILVVFACSGFSVLYLEEQILLWLAISKSSTWWIAILIFLFFTLPIYNILLLVYGFVFGQFKFFWNFEKRFFSRLIKPFGKRD